MSLERDRAQLQAAVTRGLMTGAQASWCLEAARHTGRPALEIAAERGLVPNTWAGSGDRTHWASGVASAPGAAQGDDEDARPTLDSGRVPDQSGAVDVDAQPTLDPGLSRLVGSGAVPGALGMATYDPAHTPTPPGGVPRDARQTWWEQQGSLTGTARSGTGAATGAAPGGGRPPGKVAVGRPGSIVGGDYEVVEPLGAGGMGAVYRARQTSLGREVALKVLPADVADTAMAGERFLREVRSAASVNHPNVVTIYAAGRDEASGRLFMAMELVAGGDAASLMEKSGGRLTERRALEIARDVARGLTALEAAGLVHRDIKPANLFLGADGTAKLGDLGLARGLADRMTETGTVVGTPAYMSPEQAQGAHDQIDTGTDIYAVGASLYTLLTGKPPFEAPSVMNLLRKVLDAPPPDPRADVPEISAATAAIVRRAMAKQRSARHTTAAELVADLEQALAKLVTPKGASERRLTPWLAVVALVVGGGGALAGYALRTSPAKGVGDRLPGVTPRPVPVGPSGPDPRSDAPAPTSVTERTPEPTPSSSTSESAPPVVDVASTTPAPPAATVLTWLSREEVGDEDLEVTFERALPALNSQGYKVVHAGGQVLVTFVIDRTPAWVHLRLGHLGARVGGEPDCWVDLTVNGRPVFTNDRPKQGQWFDLTGLATIGRNELRISVLPRSTTAYWVQRIQVHHGIGLPPEPDGRRLEPTGR